MRTFNTGDTLHWSGYAGLLVACAFILTGCNPTTIGDLGGSAAPVVKTKQGKVRGVAKSGYRMFLGIPYAQPPVGALRWKPPQPPVQRSSVLDATEFAPHCPQPPSRYGTQSVSEDCLYLNIFTPVAPGPHPVMVWIHGGALVVGESNDYDPVRLVQQGVIVVTFNYRLGALGFLAHPALSAESENNASGDYGLMDQRAALEWVHNNIKAFGGNPDNVTLFGESAGARSVLYLMVSPAVGDTLFQKAIIESGSGFDSITLPTLQQKEARGKVFAESVGCNNGQGLKQIAACLRHVPVPEILANQPQVASPNLHPEFLPQQIETALRNGAFKRVPVLLGTNLNEFRIFVGQAVLNQGPILKQQYKQAIAHFLRLPPEDAADIQRIAQAYPLTEYDNPTLAVSAVATDGVFACENLLLANLISRRARTYVYEFRDVDAPQRFVPPVGDDLEFSYGAYHAAELQYLFNISTPIPGHLNDSQKKLSEAMVRYWTQFAKTGNPNAPSGTVTFWPKYVDNGSGKAIALVPPSPRAVPVSTIAANHQCGFWANYRKTSNSGGID